MNRTDLTILIVDDEPANTILLQRMLEGAGYSRLLTARDGGAATKLIEEKDIDLVLLDLHMPGMDGFEVLRTLPTIVDKENFLPVLVLTADATRGAKETALGHGAKDFLTKPFDNLEVLLRVGNLLETRMLHLELTGRNERLEDEVSKRTAELRKAVARLEEAQGELEASRHETITRLATAAEYRDVETAEHIHRMSNFCSLLADRAGLEEERCDLIRLASEMHDIGKIGVPDNVLLKPGKLSEREREQMERHAEIGYRILKDSDSDLLQLAASIALAHHERIDGSGYPRGVSGSEIFLEARIATIADVFDALTTDRVYRKALDVDEALDLMVEGRGTQFDPDLFDLFLDSMDDVLVIKDAPQEALVLQHS
jgi:putative two-component system response regulator